MGVPEPVISLAITPRTKGDQEKLDRGLQRLMAEDPSLRAQTDRDTGQTIIRGNVIGTLADRHGQLQLEEDRAGIRIITATVPLSEMLGYGSVLRSRTSGRATYAVHLDRYQPFRRDPGID
jgi:translation elongation factor EF-G